MDSKPETDRDELLAALNREKRFSAAENQKKLEAYAAAQSSLERANRATEARNELLAALKEMVEVYDQERNANHSQSRAMTAYAAEELIAKHEGRST